MSVAAETVTDRLILRMGLSELKHFPAIPMRVTLDECVELAKEYGGEESPAYINGVLDNLAGGYRDKDFQEGGAPSGVAPEAVRPEAGMPEAGRPEAGRPEAGRPEEGMPEAGKEEPAA